MNQQQEIEGARPMSCRVANKKSWSIWSDMAAHGALKQLVAELKDIQKQHPSVAGLTLAIAIVARREAEAQSNMSLQVLTVAAHHGMAVERHGMAVRCEDDGMWLDATGEDTSIE